MGIVTEQAVEETVAGVDYGLDNHGQIIIYTNIYRWLDGTHHDEVEPDREAKLEYAIANEAEGVDCVEYTPPYDVDTLCNVCAVSEHDTCANNPNCPCCCDTMEQAND